METNSQHYIKIEIKGDKNKLPEKSGEYEVLFNGDFYGTAKFDKTDSIASQGVIWWINKIKVYWFPVPELQQPEQPESEKETLLSFMKFLSLKPDVETINNFIKYIKPNVSHNNTVGPTETEISAILDKANFDTSKERETAYDLIKYALSQCKAVDLRATLRNFWDFIVTKDHTVEGKPDENIDAFLKSPENK